MNTLIDISMQFVSPFETKLEICSIVLTYKKGSILDASGDFIEIVIIN